MTGTEPGHEHPAARAPERPPKVHVLAVDGGASSTRAVIGTAEGEIVGMGLAGPSNHLQGEAGKRRLRLALEVSIGAALAEAGLAAGHLPNAAQPAASRPVATQADTSLRAAWLGMSGVWEDGQEGAVVEEYTRAIIDCPAVGVGGDMHTALVAASVNRPGVIVYAGTGSVSYGSDAAGNSARSGGLGYLIDDEGGAYQVGRAALKAALRSQDGRGPETALVEALFDRFQTRDLRQLVRIIYTNDGLGRPEIAGLARLVGDAANAGDAVAREILASAAAELAELAVASVRKLPGLMPAPAVYYSGGLFRAGEALIRPFERAVQAALPGARVTPAAFPPVVGAFLLALSLAGVSLTPAVLATIERSARERDLD